MRYAAYFAFAGAVTGALLLTVFVLVAKFQNNDFPFRCSGFVRYDLEHTENGKHEFLVAQDLRFQTRDSGYLIFSGQVNLPNKTVQLNRTVELNQGEKIDNNTYRYHIQNIKASPTDNAPAEVFNLLLGEFTADPTSMQLDVDKLGKKDYLISGPLSSLFTCVRY